MTGLLFTLFSSHSQSILSDTIKVKDEITAFSQDRTGNIFLTFKGGAITKFSSNMDSLLSFSPEKLGDISLLESWHGFQIFAFYEEFQEFVLLDRFLTRATRYRLSQSSANYADMCTISSDQNLWIFEENQLRIIKLNLNVRAIDIEVPLEFILDASEHNITFLREYQNLVFLVDEYSGIYLLDNMGNYLRKIEAPGINSISFKNDHLFYLQNNEVHDINLYQGSHDIIKLNDGNYLGVLPLDNELLLVKKDMVIKLPLPLN
ncbi:MAG: hypothetical protein DRI71_01870 [Bacteroidetes bacterium]|nr:MAG: hypothetical protein DRI71_01870 [Bacteroidota bacterium]